MGDILIGWLFAFHDSYTYRILSEMFAIFLSILPGLVIGLTVSSLLTAWWPLERIRRCRFTGFCAICLMACLGVISPFCSYLAIPIAASLILAGIQPGPVFAFLCSTPLINPTLFFMTLSVFGLPMAVARMVAAFGFGILGGWIASQYSERIILYIRECSPNQTMINTPNYEFTFVYRWWKSFRHMGGFVLKYVLLGIGIAAVVKELIPMRLIVLTIGQQYNHSILVGAMLGVPLYACGGGTIPFIEVLMNMGMSQGAALAFFISGPATKISSLAALRMTVGTPITLVFFCISIIWSIFIGFLYQFIQ